MTIDVVVGKRPTDPAVFNGGLEPFHCTTEMIGGKVRTEHVECVTHVEEIIALGVIRYDLQRARAVTDLAH